MKNLFDIWDELLSHIAPKKWGKDNIDDISRIEFELQKAVPMKPLTVTKPSTIRGGEIYMHDKCPRCGEILTHIIGRDKPKGCPNCRQALDFGE